MATAAVEPYVIQSTLPTRYPRGWFCIGADYEFTTTPRKLDYFGTSLVAYRGENSGAVHLLDAYCPHMGANLAGEGSLVNGDSVICPFHAWSWGPDGVCNDIPYAKKIPEKARIRSWPVMEENQLVYMWYDPDGGEPIEEQRIPPNPQVQEDGWTPWVIRRFDVQNNARELIDNMADKAHFGPVHGTGNITHFSNICEGHMYTQLMQGNSELGTIDSKAQYFGPGYMIHEMHITLPDGVETKMMSLVMNVPTGMESFEFLAGFKYPIPPGLEGNILAQIDFVNSKIDEGERGVQADLMIWKDKVAIDNPILCDGDGPVTRLRQWYAQFLVPLDQVPESLKERKVYDKSN